MRTSSSTSSYNRNPWRTKLHSALQWSTPQIKLRLHPMHSKLKAHALPHPMWKPTSKSLSEAWNSISKRPAGMSLLLLLLLLLPSGAISGPDTQPARCKQAVLTSNIAGIAHRTALPLSVPRFPLAVPLPVLQICKNSVALLLLLLHTGRYVGWWSAVWCPHCCCCCHQCCVGFHGFDPCGICCCYRCFCLCSCSCSSNMWVWWRCSCKIGRWGRGRRKAGIGALAGQTHARLWSCEDVGLSNSSRCLCKGGHARGAKLARPQHPLMYVFLVRLVFKESTCHGERERERERERECVNVRERVRVREREREKH